MKSTITFFKKGMKRITVPCISLSTHQKPTVMGRKPVIREMPDVGVTFRSRPAAATLNRLLENNREVRVRIQVPQFPKSPEERPATLLFTAFVIKVTTTPNGLSRCVLATVSDWTSALD